MATDIAKSAPAKATNGEDASTATQNLSHQVDQSQAKASELKGKSEQSTGEDASSATAIAGLLNNTTESVQPLLQQIQSRIGQDGSNPDEATQEQTAKEVEPMISKAKGMLDSSKESVSNIDPEGKLAAAAEGKTVPTGEDSLIGGALSTLSNTVTEGVESIGKSIANMPILKSKILPFLLDLFLPVAEIVSGVGLLLGGVLNLVTDVLGLQTLFKIILGSKLRDMMPDLSLGGIMGKLGLDKALEDIPGAGGITESMGLT